MTSLINESSLFLIAITSLMVSLRAWFLSLSNAKAIAEHEQTILRLFEEILKGKGVLK